MELDPGGAEGMANELPDRPTSGNHDAHSTLAESLLDAYGAVEGMAINA